MPEAALDDGVLDVVAWVHADDGRVLTVRSRGRDLLYLPGGKREPGEDDWTAISREVREELGVALDRSSFGLLGVVQAAAHDQPAHGQVRMACFTAGYAGTLRPSAEVTEYRYLQPADRALLSPASQAALDLAIESGTLTRELAGCGHQRTRAAQHGDGTGPHGDSVAGVTARHIRAVSGGREVVSVDLG
jgi:8-oxo-dGTP diphosphatase